MVEGDEMRIQDDSRSKGDRPTIVRCACGVEALTLPPGQVLSVGGTGRTVSVTCKGCGKTFEVRVADAGSSSAPAAA